jgi:hypothetical protein
MRNLQRGVKTRAPAGGPLLRPDEQDLLAARLRVGRTRRGSRAAGGKKGITWRRMRNVPRTSRHCAAHSRRRALREVTYLVPLRGRGARRKIPDQRPGMFLCPRKVSGKAERRWGSAGPDVKPVPTYHSRQGDALSVAVKQSLVVPRSRAALLSTTRAPNRTVLYTARRRRPQITSNQQR